MENGPKFKMPTPEEIHSRQFEEYIFELVAKEIQSGIQSLGLWTKAIAEANCDEYIARGLYIKLRGQALIDEA